MECTAPLLFLLLGARDGYTLVMLDISIPGTVADQEPAMLGDTEITKDSVRGAHEAPFRAVHPNWRSLENACVRGNEEKMGGPDAPNRQRQR